MIKAIIFDFDGVIVESLDIKTRAFAELFKEEGEEVVRLVVEYHLHNGGVSRYEKFRYIYDTILGRPLSEYDFESLCTNFATLVLEGVVASPYVPGALQFLEEYRERYLMFLASATPLDELLHILDRRRIRNYFGRIYGAPTIKSDAVRIILKEEVLLPEEVLFVGDALTDYAAAFENGVHFVARIHDNEAVFEGVVCERISDLRGLHRVIADCKNVRGTACII